MKNILLTTIAAVMVVGTAFADPIHDAARDGDLAGVKAELDKGADVNAKDQYKKTPLHYATEEGHKEVAELLIAAGADVNARRGMELAIALLVIGLVLMFFEILLPGMVLGTCAVLSLFASVAVAYSNTEHGTIFLVIAIGSLAVFAIGFVYWFPNSYMGRKLISTSAVGDLGVDLSGLINQAGSAYTVLRPSGKATIGDQRVDVVTEGTMIDKGTPIRVVTVEGNRVVVREI